MKLGSSKISDKNKPFNTSVSAFMEQTNLFSLSFKQKMSESTKVIPLYLNGIDKYQYFYDRSVENFSITKEEYIELCQGIKNLFLKIENNNLKKHKLWILKRFSQTGIFLILLSLILFLIMVLIVFINYEQIASMFLFTIFFIYFICVTSFCIFYIVKAFCTHKHSVENIKKLNMYIFKLNVKHRDKGIEFRLHASSKELMIHKIL